MYMNILVPVSFDEVRDMDKALKVALLLADEGARITLIHVMEHIPGYAVSYLPADYRSASRDAIKTELEGMVAGVDGGIGVVIEGHSGRSILDYADENKADCIVIASHRPGMQDYFLGSTAARVVRHASCSVHVIR